MSAEMKGMLRPNVYRFKAGNFEVVTILDAQAVREGPHPRIGADQKPETVRALLDENRLTAPKFEHPFVPTLVNTGKELVLFDTGNGTLKQEVEALKNAVPDGNLVKLLGGAGYKPEDIDIVVTTHGHPDHVGGLMAAGKPVFPNARYVIGAAEFDYWKKNENISDARKGTQAVFMRNVAPLAEKMTFIKPGDSVVSGITSVDASGHSAGMLAYHIESEGARLLIWADTALHYVVSLQRPDWQNDVDDDRQKAAATRKRIFDMVATDKIFAIGYHMPFPSVGHVEKYQGAYRWLPASYQFNLG